jgi:hypothetical protein
MKSARVAMLLVVVFAAQSAVAAETVAQKFGNAPELIAFAILAPHPRMNVALSRREAQDIASYIATLAK